MPVLVSSVLESSSLGLIGQNACLRSYPLVFIVTADSRDVSLCPFWQFPVPFLETRAPI